MTISPSIRRRGLAWAIAGLVAAAPWAAAEAEKKPAPPAAAAQRPNIALVLIDTLRADHLPFYGYQHPTARFMTDLAKRSVVFSNAFSSSSWTAPSTASLLTAAYCQEHGVVRGFFAQRKLMKQIEKEGKAELELNAIDASMATLPEVLRDAGYKTFGAAANFNIGEEMGFARGFDRFKRIVERSAAVDAKSVTGEDDDDSAERIQEVIRGWKKEIEAADPFFLYLHFNDPHGPYRRHDRWYRDPAAENAPPIPKGGKAVLRYDSEIGYVDDVLAQIFEEFRLGENTIVIIVSDHGQAFGDHGKRGHGPNTGLMGVVNRVLMLVHAPAHGVGSAVVADPVSLVDVAPTLLEMIGHAGLPGDRPGRSLVPFLRSDAPDREQRLVTLRERPLYAHVVDKGRAGRPEGTRAVMHDGWKLVDTRLGPELYHIAEDPKENEELSAAQPQQLARLQALLATHHPPSEVRAKPPAPKVELDAADLEKLRMLGYTED